MARDVLLADDKQLAAFEEFLFKAVQSSHLNFLFGAGASCPAVSAAGGVEQEIIALLEAGDAAAANRKAVGFLKGFVAPMKALVAGDSSGQVGDVLNEHIRLINAVDAILVERKTNLLPKQASVFTTNYDLFFESACERTPSINLSDGIYRAPSLTGRYPFRSEKLFDATHHTGNHYEYTAEVPTINLVKLHGSFTWQYDVHEMIFHLIDFDALAAIDEERSELVAEFLSTLAVILPTQKKLQQTILDRTYYDLLRIFANVLEKENTLLIAFGFSFRDEHVFDIVRRSLRNPTLKLLVSCFTAGEAAAMRERFASYNNVSLLVPSADGDLTLAKLNAILEKITTPKVSDGGR